MSIDKAASVPRFGGGGTGGPGELGPEDQKRARGLKKMRTLALSLLILATLIFLSTHLFTDNTGVWGFVSRASEAAMIGAIADWFAVTALFRHPLGLPIPHTAIIPRKKDTLGASLSAFVAANFLHAEAVSTKIRSVEVSHRAGEWLAKPGNRDIVVERAAGGLEYVLARIDDDSIKALTRNVIVPRLVATRKTPVLAQLLRQIVLDGAHHRLVDLVISEAHTWLHDNPQVIDEIVHNRAPSWVHDFVNEQLANRLQREVLGWVADVRDNEYHKARQALDAWLVDLSDDLESDSSLSVPSTTIPVLPSSSSATRWARGCRCGRRSPADWPMISRSTSPTCPDTPCRQTKRSAINPNRTRSQTWPPASSSRWPRSAWTPSPTAASRSRAPSV